MHIRADQRIRVAVLLFSVPLLFFCHSLNAQKVTVSPHGLVGSPTIIVKVRQGFSHLEGAVVELYTPSDTLHGVTSDFGSVEFPNRYKRDSVLLKVSYLGYKPVSYKTKITLSSPVFEVEMEEDTTQLNAIIITDDAIAMVVHGDTTIFNAAAFNMRDKDPLGKLLEKIPGITIENGEVTANGQKVSKILINGQSLFGNNVSAAMDMIYNEDIRKVRIYDEHDQDRLIEADTLGMKERVVDVVTNKPINYVQGGDLGLNAGVFTDKGNKGKVDWLAGGNARYRRFGKEIRNIDLLADAGKDIKAAAPLSSPEINAGCDLTIMDSKKRKSSLCNHIIINYSDKSSESISSDIYSPSESYAMRMSDYTEQYSGKTLNASYKGWGSYAVTEKDLLGYQVDVVYNGAWSDKVLLTESVIDDNISTTDTRTLDRNNSGSITGDLTWRRYMAKQGRYVNVLCKYSGSFGGGGGTRKTDSPDILLRQSLVDSSSIKSLRVNVSAEYNEPVTDKLSLTASYGLDGSYSFSRRISWDEILNARNMVNTYEYTQNEITNTLTATILYMPSDIAHIALNLEYKNIYQFRRETLPAGLKSPDSYNYFGPLINIYYMPGTYRIMFRYSEVATPPSIEQKRNTINDSNPLFLIGGNPELKLPVIRTAEFNTSFNTASISTNWNIIANYTEYTGNIVNKIIFYPETSSLEQYGGYKVSAGTQLSQPVNVNGNRSFTGRVVAGIFSKPLKSTITPSVSYTFARNPFFLQEERLDNINHDIDFGLSYMSSFSKYFSLNISNRTTIGRSLRSGEKIYDRLSETVTARAEANFLKRMVVTADVVYDMFRTDSGFGDFEKVYLNAAVGIHLDKQEKSTIWLKGYDLLGMDNSNRVTISELYVRSKYSTILGRSVFLSYQYKF